MKNRFVCTLLLALLIASCKKATVTPDTYKEYIIPQGEHYALNNDFRTIKLHQLKFTALFDSSCIYTTTKDYNAGDVNKLYGFSDCNTMHHVNSARFGWRWTGHELEILVYCYVDSARVIQSLGNIAIGRDAHMSITVQPENYLFELNGVAVTMPRHCSTDSAEGYQLYPYFGGDEVAPHEIRIRIKQE